MPPEETKPDKPGREDGELVEVGEFRVSREHALQKLRDYQLPDPYYGIFFWVRAAAASGATRFSVRRGLRSLELRFDGKPLTEAELDDPYTGLFAEHGGRGRQFAQAFLWLTRFAPASVTVDSGGRRLSVNARGEFSLSGAAPEAPDTVVRVYWKWGMAARHMLVPLWPDFAKHCGESGMAITVSGKELPKDPFAGHAVVREFSVDGARVRMSHHPRNSHGAKFTTVSIFHLGVRLQFQPDHFWHTWEPSLFMPCVALVGGDGVDTDLTGFSVVKNERLGRLLERIRSEEKPLLRDLIKASYHTEDADLMSALRDAAFMLKTMRKLSPGDPVMEKLWDAPIVPDASGKRWPLAKVLEDIDAYRWKIGIHTLTFLEMLGGGRSRLEPVDRSPTMRFLEMLGGRRRNRHRGR